jgi:PAS domain S-box-containing protein
MKPDLSFLAGGGEMGERTRAMDWSATVLGPIEGWSTSLKAAVSICLGSRHPMVLWWGKTDLTQLYNDAYISLLGTEKHPAYLGRSARQCWSEIWPIMGPMLDHVFRTGEATWSEDFLYVLNRNLPREEGYFTFSYSPIRDDDGAIGGIFCACNETTARVLSERRLKTLRDLSRMEAEARTVETTCEIAARTLGENRHDIPFALIYLLDGDGRQAELVAASAIEAGGASAPRNIDLQDASDSRCGWPLRTVLETGTAQVVSDVSGQFGALSGGPWPEPPDAALIVPIAVSGQTRTTGFLVSGLSPRRVVDSDYVTFLSLVAGHIGTSLANARAYEAERRRAEALAEIDRAKTLFFSNVSHEFRTPLTLMLGPLEATLTSTDLPSGHRENLETAHRNSLRLLKLVNSLLDFSRIEANRAQATYEPTDLATLTAALASNFRSACERASLKLIINCEPSDEPVYVDRDMWEKIVLNLVSNAFKFTFAGEVLVSLRTVGRQVQLCVRDTGVGIPAHELPRLFERFHRIEGQKSRTHEGSGIGLALVQELVRLHGGTISADSVVGRGTAFMVNIPTGRSHLPQDRIKADGPASSTAVRPDAFVQEALCWLADRAPPLDGVPTEIEAPQPAAPELHGARILVADDNSDMRSYVSSLLGRHCEVQAFADGQAALDVMRERAPDLVLADVMMPRLDGFGLVQAIRGDRALADIPVVLLSARAGEEAKIEGLAAGADDYLVKPFHARELLARVSSNLNLARLRRQAAADLQDMNRLHEVAKRSVRGGNEFEECLEEILAAAIAIPGADKGNIQLLESGSDCLKIAVQRGFEAPFLQFFAQVRAGDGSASGRALEAVDRVIVEDVTQSDIFGESSLDVLLQAGVRAVQSTPLVSGDGATLGMISTHFSQPHRPSERQLRVIDLLARQAGDYLERKEEERFRRRAETIVRGQKRVLEMVATATPLDEILDALLLFIESLEPGIICGLLLTDDCVHFRPGSGPSIPAGYKKALLETVKTVANPPPYFATCCEAVQCDRVVLVSDVAKERKYADAWRESMLASGLKAVRSTPVHASDGRILGCLALYFVEPREPNPADAELVDMATQLAAIAIERDCASTALQRQKAQFETLLNQAPLGVYLVDSQFRIRAVNPTAQYAFGEAPGGMAGRDFAEFIHTIWEKKYADEIVAIFRHTLETGESLAVPERAVVRADRAVMEYYEWRVDRITLPDGSFGVVCYFRDISDQVQAALTRQLLISELNHRVKNTLASVQAIAQQTVRSTKDPADFATRFSGRIQSLARVHSLLTDSTWRGADLRELIRDQLLGGAVDDSRLTASGPTVHLQPQTAVHVAVMLHELGTNSIKYGALSAAKGWVTVNWSVAGDVLNLQWVERGGPTVSAPARRGFGTALIEQSAKSEGGNAEQLFEPEGLTWKISLTLRDSDADQQPVRSPELKAPPIQPQEAALKPATRLSGLRLLIIEDESLIALDLVDRLEIAGADVAAPVSTEERALKAIADGDFDCALLDANLHGRPVDAIAAALTRRKIPFVFITGYGRTGLTTCFQQSPVLAKPVNDDQLFDAIITTISRPRKIFRVRS